MLHDMNASEQVVGHDYLSSTSPINEADSYVVQSGHRLLPRWQPMTPGPHQIGTIGSIWCKLERFGRHCVQLSLDRDRQGSPIATPHSACDNRQVGQMAEGCFQSLKLFLIFRLNSERQFGNVLRKRLTFSDTVEWPPFARA